MESRWIPSGGSRVRLYGRAESRTLKFADDGVTMLLLRHQPPARSAQRHALTAQALTAQAQWRRSHPCPAHAALRRAVGLREVSVIQVPDGLVGSTNDTFVKLRTISVAVLDSFDQLALIDPREAIKV